MQALGLPSVIGTKALGGRGFIGLGEKVAPSAPCSALSGGWLILESTELSRELLSKASLAAFRESRFFL